MKHRKTKCGEHANENAGRMFYGAGACEVKRVALEGCLMSSSVLRVSHAHAHTHKRAYEILLS